MGSDDTLGKVKDPLVAAIQWLKTRPAKTKTALGGLGALLLLLTLWRTIKDHDTLFVLAEMAHFIGIGVLGYKLQKKKSVAGERRHAGHGLHELPDANNMQERS